MDIAPEAFFVLGFDGPEPSREVIEGVKKGLGGVIYFARNVTDRDRLAALSGRLQALSPKRLLIGVDQEGGRVARLKGPGFTRLPAALAMAAEDIPHHAQNLATDLKNVGINLDFAPVLDIHTNPKNPVIGDRAFGRTAEAVIARTAPFIATLHAHGVHACGKHFPGHGDTGTDSHLTLPVVRKSRGALAACEFRPFRAAAAANLHFLMTAHVLYPALDAKNPATFSAAIVTDLLKKDWGYGGVVITDDLVMAGARDERTLTEAAIAAFAAGCDLLLISHEFERHAATMAAFGAAINKSPALKERARAALGRLKNIPEL